VGGDQQVIGAEHFAGGFQRGPKLPVFDVRRFVEWQNLDFGKQFTNLLAKACGPFPEGAVPQFDRRDDACEDIVDTSVEYLPGDAPLRVFDRSYRKLAPSSSFRLKRCFPVPAGGP
jgi:hypothetical protein